MTADQANAEVPCQCHQTRAAVTPWHAGHCCFSPANRVCHPDEVAAWEAKNASRTLAALNRQEVR